MIGNWENKLANKLLGRISKRVVNFFEHKVLSYYKRFDVEGLRILREVWKEDKNEVFFSPHELFMVYSTARAWREHGGDVAEVGVFKGASAKVICEAKKEETNLFLFDTFKGLQDTKDLDSRFADGMFTADEDRVKERLKRYKNVHISKGFFPKDTGYVVENKKFSFVHLDVDTHDSTLACLDFFKEKMLPGGAILSHDYAQCEGVYRAFQEFLQKTQDFKALELSVSQILLIKT